MGLISDFLFGGTETNKLFSSQDQYNESQSQLRFNRDYLLSQKVADEMNTYRSFSPFAVFTDAYDAADPQPFGPAGVRSIFNKHGAVLTGDSNAEKIDDNDISSYNASPWRISNNVPLIDTPLNRRNIKSDSNCSVKELVAASQEGRLGRETYDYSDFMYCKHLGKMSNNYMITLRRFPTPVDDYISSLGTGEVRKNKDISSQNPQSIGCMVTWIGTPGNEMSNILKYSVSLPFKSEEAQWEDNSTSGDSQTNKLNGIAAMFDKTYRKQYELGMAGSSVNATMKEFFPKFSDKVLGSNPYNVQDFEAFRDNKKVYGPVDAVKSTYVRDKGGLAFDQNITIIFDYELRSYNGINGRQAFLDLLSNILMVTYSTGSFWAGGYKSTGAHQNNIFANMKTFKTHGGVTNFIESFIDDAQTIGNSIKFPKSLKEFANMAGNALNQLGGMIIAGQLNKLGRPHKVMLQSLLSPAPVGFWHLTIGNPFHPIMSIGNMILKQTTIEHYGPLGLDDFPTGIKVTCELTRGKPRDIRDIEKLYMHGNDRIYHSMGPKIFDMYTHAKEYNDNNFDIAVKEIGDPNVEIGTGENKTIVATIADIGKMSKVLQKYFGHTDTYSIYISSAEQEYGASKPSQQDYNNKNHGGKQT